MGAPVFPGSSRLGIEPKTPGWLVQDPTTSPSGDLIPTIRGSGAHPGRGCGRKPIERCVGLFMRYPNYGSTRCSRLRERRIMSRCLICAGDGKLLVKASATMRWVRRGTSLMRPPYRQQSNGGYQCGGRTCAEQDFRTWRHRPDYLGRYA